MAAAATETILYVTRSVCPLCTLGVGGTTTTDSQAATTTDSQAATTKEHRWIDARVVARDGQSAWLTFDCPTHGRRETLYCSDLAFFKRMLKVGGGLEFQANQEQQLPDIESLHALLAHPPPCGSPADAGGAATPSMRKSNRATLAPTMPFSVELPLWDAEAKSLHGEAALCEQLGEICQRYALQRKRFVLNVSATISTDIAGINQRVAALLRCSDPLLKFTLEATYERLVLLAALDDSVLLNARVFPAVKYTLVAGQEAACRAELDRAVQALQQIDGIQLVLTLNVPSAPPLPDLADVLAFVRAHPATIRFCVFSLFRSSSALYQQLRDIDASHVVAGATPTELHSIDCFGIVRAVEDASRRGGDGAAPITADDFVPARVGMVLEPFLQQLGYGSYHVRPSPLCAFAVCLVNTRRLPSVPLTRLFDVARFFRNLLPLIQKLCDEPISWLLAQRLRWIVKKCALPNPHLSAFPDVLAYLMEPAKVPAGRKVIDRLQFIVVHNNMDFACTDMLRRAQCSVMTPLSAKNPKFVSRCSCI